MVSLSVLLSAGINVFAINATELLLPLEFEAYSTRMNDVAAGRLPTLKIGESVEETLACKWSTAELYTSKWYVCFIPPSYPGSHSTSKNDTDWLDTVQLLTDSGGPDKNKYEFIVLI